MASNNLKYYAGRDVKSLGLNLASTMLLLWPIISYYLLESSQHRWIFTGFVLGSVILAILLPPIGYMRPHPYSDIVDHRLPKKTT